MLGWAVSRHSVPNGQRRGLALFFTLGVRLVDWEKAGFLQSEVKYYCRLSKHVGPITFVTYGSEEDRDLAARLDGIRLITNDHHLPSKTFQRRIPRLCREVLADAALVKSNQIQGAQAALETAALTGAQAVVRGGYLLSRFAGEHESSLPERFSSWRRELAMFHQADRVLLATQDDAIYARRWYSLPSQKVQVLPNFVDTSLFTPREDVACEPGLIGFVGRLMPHKNLPSLIEAMVGLKDARLRLIGDGPQRDALLALASERGVCLEMIGSVPHEELPRLLAECEVFALPSFREALPRTLLEAMAAGLPVLTSAVNGGSAVIQHRENGWLCDDATPASMRRGLETLLRDSRLRTQIGRSARRYVADHFAMETVVAREVAVYQEMGCV